MAKTTNPFDSLSDRLDTLSFQIDYLISIMDSKMVTPISSESPLLTTRQAAEFLGISPKTIYNHSERFNPVKLKRGGLRFRKVDLERLLA